MRDIDINLKALEVLRKREFAKAQRLFIKNRRLFPSYRTYNNLGRFYAEFGCERKDGRVVKANKFIERYLKKSLELQPNALAYKNLAYHTYELYIYEDGSLEDAESYQAEVMKLNPDNIDVYNYAVILYHLKKYELGLEYLDKIIHNHEDANWLYLLYLLKMDKLSQNALKRYKSEELELFSQQHFYYHIRDYGKAVSVTERYPSENLEVDLNSLAIYINSLLKLLSISEIKKQTYEICRKMNIDSLEYGEMLATSSAAGGLKMTVHGLVYDMTAKAAKEAAKAEKAAAKKADK
jgi:tetratricopeptide (TPR) repeat protein